MHKIKRHLAPQNEKLNICATKLQIISLKHFTETYFTQFQEWIGKVKNAPLDTSSKM